MHIGRLLGSHGRSIESAEWAQPKAGSFPACDANWKEQKHIVEVQTRRTHVKNPEVMSLVHVVQSAVNHARKLAGQMSSMRSQLYRSPTGAVEGVESQYAKGVPGRACQVPGRCCQAGRRDCCYGEAATGSLHAVATSCQHWNVGEVDDGARCRAGVGCRMRATGGTGECFDPRAAHRPSNGCF